jgi:hypothetical protein
MSLNTRCLYSYLVHGFHYSLRNSEPFLFPIFLTVKPSFSTVLGRGARTPGAQKTRLTTQELRFMSKQNKHPKFSKLYLYKFHPCSVGLSSFLFLAFRLTWLIEIFKHLCSVFDCYGANSLICDRRIWIHNPLSILLINLRLSFF